MPFDDYYGPGSPLERFVRLGGRVLRLGADLVAFGARWMEAHLTPAG